MTTQNDEVPESRRERILQAAGEVFGRYGYRKMTMEGAAEAAHVAKATLYSYYRNKDALFKAVAQQMADRLASDFIELLQGQGAVEDRARSALIQKNMRVFQSVRRLPHAQDLLLAKDRLAHPIFLAADQKMIAALSALLGTRRPYASHSQAISRTLFFGSHGIAEQCVDASALDAEIGLFVETYLAGCRATKK